MSWVTVIWSMLAAACLTFAAVHLPVWLRNRTSWPNFFIAFFCLGTAGIVLGEVSSMKASIPAEYAAARRWSHAALFVVIASLTGFVYTYLRAGRLWLALTAVGLRAFSVVLTFASSVSITFLEIRELRTMQFLGEPVAVPVGVPNPLMVVAQLSIWVCIAFVADASITAWRRGDRGRALRVGGSTVLFLVAGGWHAVFLVWAGLQLPPTYSPYLLAIIAAISFDMSRDVLRAQQLALQLGESEQRMVLAARAANLGIWSRDVARDETWASEQCRELLGFAPHERVTRATLAAKAHPDDRERLLAVMVQTESEPGVHHLEFRVALPGGGVRWVETQGQAEFDHRGRPVRVRGAAMDCTWRKQSEQETLLLRQEIAHVGRVSVMGQLASALAHEINQPLGAILRNAEAARLFLDAAAPDLEEIRRIVDDIRKDDQRAGAVIDRMHALLKRNEVDVRPLPVDELFTDVATLLRPEAVARRVTLDLDIAKDVSQVSGDKVQLQQVLLNLVSNGMDAIDETDRRPRSIVVAAKRESPAMVEIAVSDSGSGIPRDRMDRLFDPFFTSKKKGMGMGLSISRTIVEAHGGRLWAENSNMGGARFCFTLPTPQARA